MGEPVKKKKNKQIITELRDNSLKIKRDMTESQVNNHWILSEM